MYTDVNFRTKKALRDAVALGKKVGVYQPGPFGGQAPTDGVVALEGPHYPEPHKWYAQATLEGGFIVKVDGKVPVLKFNCSDCGAANPAFRSPCSATGDVHSMPKEVPAKPRAKRKAGRGRIAFGCENIAHWCSGCPAGCFL